MSCPTVRRSLSAFVDHELPEAERNSVSQHLVRCRDCAARSQELLGLRRILRELPLHAVPEELASELQVLVSHEKARRAVQGGVWGSGFAWFRQMVDELMRPIAIPFAGGLASAVFLFSMLTPTLTIRWSNPRNDVPTGSWLYTGATLVETAPFSFRGEIEIELTIDRNGQITDYSVTHGNVPREWIDKIGNNLLFSGFQPATMFGQPISGKVRVSFQQVGDHIVVRG
jgi:hypothetical protein